MCLRLFMGVKMKSKLATCTVMVMTDGTISKYAVMVGPMGKKYFNAHKAKTVATYVMPSTGSHIAIELFEREMTAKHATAEAPPVPWQTAPSFS